ncbi:hypothetical protein M9978_01680 [Sphingomonas sp. MG17]|uniref:Tetratricopeptide repeat-containing protein n=1 Tax=Sphingomonas tagetis TaxID=2949092 RepID=A0A9X2HHT8_9SPHN|nr:hypothetical protein [Sphingomonas tagetis]MCP3729126.1 hypothetical protein [Sphingomonas tagetis]
MNRKWALLGASLFCLTPVAAQEAVKPADYLVCDGYPAPRPKKSLKPGETQPVWRGWGYQGTTTAKRVRGFNVVGVVACEKVLADPVLVPEFWQRRASLIQARALHELGENSNDTAMKTLDEVEKLYADNDKFGALPSVKLANDALRAVALYRAKKPKEAEAMLASIDARRPYAMSVRRMTSSVRMLFDSDRAKRMAQLRQQAALNPQALRLMFILSMRQADFDNALLYADQLTFDLPRQRGGWTLRGEEGRRYEQISERASLAGARAYALLAVGRTEESAKQLAAARAEVATAIEPPPPAPDGRKQSKKVTEDYSKRVAAGTQATAALDQWSAAMAIRLRAPKMTAKQLAEEKPTGEGTLVIADLLGQVKAADLAEAQQIGDTIEAIHKFGDAALTKALSLNFSGLVGMLPLAEADGLGPKMRGEGSNLWRSNLDGWRVMDADDPALFNVRFGGTVASPASLEEAALLVAANHAASLGKDAFVIESAQMVKRSTTMYGMYYSGGTVDSGHEMRMLIRPLGYADADAKPRQWRAFKVAEVRAALAGKYPVVE